MQTCKCKPKYLSRKIFVLHLHTRKRPDACMRAWCAHTPCAQSCAHCATRALVPWDCVCLHQLCPNFGTTRYNTCSLNIIFWEKNRFRYNHVCAHQCMHSARIVLGGHASFACCWALACISIYITKSYSDGECATLLSSSCCVTMLRPLTRAGIHLFGHLLASTSILR